MFKIINGHSGYAHVSGDDWKMILIALFGNGKKVFNQYGQQLATESADEYNAPFAAEISGANTVRVKSGLLIDNGCAASINANDYQEVEFAQGGQNYRRIDLLVAYYVKDSGTGIEEFTLKSLTGTPGTTYESCVLPEYTVGDLSKGALIDTVPLYKVYIKDYSIERVEKIFE